MQKRGQRGQVTIFVILGIVMLVVIIFALFVSSTLAKLKVQGAANKAVDAYLASEAVNYYVYTCMDSAVTSAIEDLALQGGTFFDYQSGPYQISEADVGKTYVPYNITYTNNLGVSAVKYFNVSYSILNRSYCELVNTTVPYYPYIDTFISELYGLYNNRDVNNNCLFNYKEGYALSGFAGFNNMSRLCMLGGNNTMSISNIEFSPCYKSIIKEANRSVEYLLEQQISLRMKNCTKFEVFIDDNITVLNDPVTRVIYTSESLFAETTYNLSVRIKNKEPVVVKHSFNYKSDLRIVRLHNYVMSLLKADSQDFFFSTKDNYISYTSNNDLNPEIFFDGEYMTVKVTNFTKCDVTLDPICGKYKYDHVLVVEDKKSKIGNHSLTYVTAMKNRIPALDFMHQTLMGSEYDIVASDGQEIKLTPMGYDPDDEKVTYKYEGWKETWDDECTLQNSPPGPGPVPLINLFNCIKTNNAPASYQKNWSQSFLFRDTKKDANYTTNRSDRGPHVVRITTIDESGLFDFQDVKILVFDAPTAVISPIQVYPDIPENVTSIEDKFILNGSLSTASVVGGGSITAYLWSIMKLTSPRAEVFANRTQEKSIIVPTESYVTTDDNKLIQIIKLLNLSNKGEHNVSLVVESNIPIIGAIIYSPPSTLALDVTECLPHESSDPPFPYNTGNPFLADHACCNGGYNFEDTNKECYQANRYGALSTLSAVDLSNNNRFTDYTENTNSLLTVNKQIAPGIFGNDNDIYVLNFERFCDGNRGNICAGPMKRTISVQWVCSDMLPGESETCSGPSTIVSNSPINTCVSYSPGTSFERIFDVPVGGQPATGICNTGWKCSSLGSNGYGNGGKLFCRGACSSGTCKYAQAENCQCIKGTCGAICASPSSDYTRAGTTCSYSCSLNTCDYAMSRTLPCTGSSCYSEPNRHCYSGVICDASGGNYVEGDYCKPGLDPVNDAICLHPSSPTNLANRCGGANSRTCLLEKDDVADAPTCDPVTEELVCDSDDGWICISA